MANFYDRRERDLALEGHVQDRFAHSAAFERFMLEAENRRVERDREVDERLGRNERQLSDLVKFRYMIQGGLLVVAAGIGGGVVTLYLHLLGVRV